MNDDGLKYDAMYWLRTCAADLNAIDTPSQTAKPSYEIWSGAIIWSDETSPAFPVELIWALNQLFAYRTKLLLEAKEPDIPFWTECVDLFPKWIGFLPERRIPTPEVLAEYRRGDVSLRWCLRKIERDADTETG